MVEWFMAISAVLSLQSTPAQPPATKWIVDHSESSCRATRTFGGDDAGATLIINAVPTQSSVTLSLLLPQAVGEKDHDQRGSADITLSPSGQKLATGYHLIHAGDGMRRFHLWIPRAAFSQFGAATEITFDVGEKHSLALTGTASLLRALGDCEKSFLTAWGVNPSQDSPAVFATPKGTMVPTAFGPNAYPADAVGKAEGLAVALLAIDAKGKVTGCGVAASSGSPSLDRATCGAFAGHGAIFEPAQDGQGAAMASKVVIPVTWTSPAHAERAEAAAPGSIIVTSR